MIPKILKEYVKWSNHETEDKALIVYDSMWGSTEKIAFMLVFGFIALLISSMLFTGTVDDAIKLIQTISSAISGMVGAVLGYYYGSSGLKDTNPPNNQ